MPYSFHPSSQANSSDEHDLLTKFRNGDQDAFNIIYECYYTLIYVYCLNQLGVQDAAQDITTETFVKLWRFRTDFSTLPKVKFFLYAVSKNACLDYFRRRNRTRLKHKEIKYLTPVMTEEAAIIDAHVYVILSQEVEKLPHNCKTIFKLIFYQNMTTGEVAEKLGISNQNVLNQKAKAIRILKEWFRAQNQLVLLAILEEMCRNRL